MDNKINLRHYAKELRKKLNLKIDSEILTQKIIQTQIYSQSQNIMLYYPTKFEINLLELLKDKKNFYFPKVSGKELLVCPASGQYEKSKFNIMEPCSNPINPTELDLVIVPALMADKNGYRLGYGGGFYDRFLSDKKIPTITAISKELFVENLPHNEFDCRIDYIITT